MAANVIRFLLLAIITSMCILLIVPLLSMAMGVVLLLLPLLIPFFILFGTPAIVLACFYAFFLALRRDYNFLAHHAYSFLSRLRPVFLVFSEAMSLLFLVAIRFAFLHGVFSAMTEL